MKAKTFSLASYVPDIRNRFLIIFISIGVSFGVSYIFSKEIVDFIQRTISQKLIFISPAEAFYVNLKVSFFAGIFLSVPLILYQLLKLIDPIIKVKKKHAFTFISLATILFLTGVMFAYFLVIPLCAKFLLRFSSEQLQPLITIDKYLSFSLKLMLACGFLFQLPLIILFLTRFNIITYNTLAKNRKYIILLCFIVSTVLTPPDVFSQLLMALPMIVLFEIGLIISKKFEKKKDLSKSGDRLDESVQTAIPK